MLLGKIPISIQVQKIRGAGEDKFRNNTLSSILKSFPNRKCSFSNYFQQNDMQQALSEFMRTKILY